MKKYKIFKWFHYSNFIPCIRKLNGDQIIEKTFSFTDSCRYKIDEKSCVNKLFGFSFGIFGVHDESARFGWTYDSEKDKIIIWQYYYKNKKLKKIKVYECLIGENYNYKFKMQIITKEPNISTREVRMYIEEKQILPIIFETNKKFILTLGPYFGGKTRSPHTITLLYENHD